MSINFHAYQCRDYLLSDYEEIEKQWTTLFTNYDPKRVIRILNLERDEQYLYIKYFQTLFRLRLEDGTLEKQYGESHALEESGTNQDNTKKGDINASSANTSSYIKILPNNKLYLNSENTAPSSDKGWTTRVYFNEAMVIYHLLYYVKDHAYLSGTWIPNTALDTRASRNNQKEDLLFTSFSKYTFKPSLAR